MFHVGRYDPRAEDEKDKKRKRAKEAGKKGQDRVDHEGTPSGNRRKGNRDSLTTTSNEGGKQKLGKDDVNSMVQKRGDVEDSNQGDSFSFPDQSRTEESDKSDSSSSVPSSTDDEDDRSEPGANIHSSLRIIAPEQQPISSIKKSSAATDEAFDDFDIEDDLVEDSASGRDREDSSHSHASKEIATALHMSSLPIKEAALAWDLAPFLVENLQLDGYEHFFPIQSLVIPDVIASERHSHIRARDVCVSAPTGSGKTLAFVLPVLNALAKRKIQRLRALVVLPSRDLASQVFQVFERYTRGSDLRVGLAVGQSDFKVEQEALTVGPRRPWRTGDIDEARHRYLLHRGNLGLTLEAFPGVGNAGTAISQGTFKLPKGGKSAVDVLVATPGRLIDHLDKTPGFTLQHLQFLVIDEADRLVNQSYHSWIGRVVNAANDASVSAWNDLENEKTKEPKAQSRMTPLNLSPGWTSFDIDPITWRRGGSGGYTSAFSTNDAFSSVPASVCRPVQLRKLLYSATLTKDPQKLASLSLVNAKHFDAHHLNAKSQYSERSGPNSYSMPPGLAEHTVECTAEQKPLVLLALLLEHTKSEGNKEGTPGGIVVVFTSNLDSTHRLVRLLQLLWAGAKLGSPNSIAEFSSALSQKQRSSLMRRCNASNGDVSVVVCSDGMSRGMDLPSVSAIVNYDVPSYAKTYVHRCGRTARAGREGTAISVLKGGQVAKFKRMRTLIDSPDRVSPFGVRKELVRSAMPVYGSCIEMLRNVIEAEKEGELDIVAAIPDKWIPVV